MCVYQGWIQDFKLGGGALNKNAPSGGRREHFWGISCEKSRFYAKKSYFFQFLRGGGGGRRMLPPESAPVYIYKGLGLGCGVLAPLPTIQNKQIVLLIIKSPLRAV
jgi:hypothetical protein